LWVLPPAVPIAPGTFVFTTDGAFAGLGVSHNGQGAIIPAALLFRAVDQLQRRSGSAGDVGIAIQPLSPALAAATGASTGVVISAVDPSGAAAGVLLPTEVIEAIDGQDVHTPDHWRARMARASAGDTLTLRVRSAEGVREVQVTAAAPAAATEPTDEPSLGLRLRAIPKIGVEVLSVQPRSRAARAEIQEGDIITVAGGQPSPTPAEVMRVFTSLPDGGSLVVAITRGTEQRVVVIDK
jgi:S1-C subfamily serine protease